MLSSWGVAARKWSCFPTPSRLAARLSAAPGTALAPSPPSPLGSRQIHATAPAATSRQRVRKLRKVNELKEERYKMGSDLVLEPTIVTSPLSQTEHPENKYMAAELELVEEVRKASADDRPDFDLAVDDPYNKEEVKCILCPRRYSVPIRPHYKNPKLLAQFVSPHTGLVYKSHITGLCAAMQAEVEVEVKRAQSLGFLATKQKELHYLKDPPLFSPSKPMKKNPY